MKNDSPINHPFGRLLLKLAVLCFSALGLWLLISFLDIQDRPQGGFMALVGSTHGWRDFVWLWAPLGLVLGTICGEFIIIRSGKGNAAAWRWDWLTFLALPLMGLLAALDQKDSNWALAIGAVYLAALAAKTGLACHAIWRAASDGKEDSATAWGTALIALAFFLGLSFWTGQAVSTAGDETRYILEAERLLQSAGLMNEHSPREGYYWGRWSEALAWTVPQSPLMKWFIAPGILLAGRLGAMAVLSLAAALALGLLVSLSRGLGFSSKTVLLGVWVLGGSAPWLQASQHLYPSAFGVLGVSLGLWLLLRPTAKWPLGLGAAALTGLGMGLIKYRLGTSGIGLMGSAAAEALRRLGCPRLLRVVVAALGTVLALALILMLAQAWLGWDTWIWRSIAHYHWNMEPPWGHVAASLPAMFMDQQFGLLAYAPWLAMGLIGVFQMKRHSKQILYHTLWLSFCIIAPLVVYRWLQWDGGFTPPGRFLATLLPVLAIWALPVLQRPVGKSWRWFCAALILLTWLVSFILALVPQWRYHRMNGMNNILVWLGDLLHSPLHRLFPSFGDYYPPGMLLALIWLAVLAGIGGWWWLANKNKPADSAASFAPLDWLRGSALLALALVALVILGRTTPTGLVEAESLHRWGSAGLHGSYFTEHKLLLLNRPGACAATQVVWPGGTRELELQVYAVVFSQNPQYKPVKLGISLEGGSQTELVIIPKDNWPKPHLIKLTAPPGWRRLKIVYVSGQNQLALDRVVIH
jgi:hypothetical protein